MSFARTGAWEPAIVMSTTSHMVIDERDTPPRPAPEHPLVSVIVANHNGGAFVEDALASCQRQTVRNIEVIVVDDASTDDSVERIAAVAGRDDRIRLIRLHDQAGPGGARNCGFDAARGTWLAVLDSDDIMHPQRLSQLVDAAVAARAEIVADNQMLFDNDGRIPSSILLDLEARRDPVISLEEYIASNCLFTRSMPLGYLKPLISRALIESGGYRYDTSLRIAEDYDLIYRLLLDRARFVVTPAVTYFYRRHSNSISHRLSRATLLPMLAANDPPDPVSADAADRIPGSVRRALARRRRTIERALHFEDLVHAIKSREWKTAIALSARRPDVAGLLVGSLRDRLKRSLASGGRKPPTDATTRRVTLLSRQRIVGTTNGSSAYLLSLCGMLRDAGYEIDLISPSPAMFGRWPFFRLDPSMDLFASIRIRGSVRLGRVVLARDPRIACRAALGVAHRLLRRLHLDVDRLEQKAPHAIAVPLTDADRVFIANTTRRSAAILTDYAFLNEATPFTLQPRLPSAVVMHDLFSAQDPTRAIVFLDQEREIALLDLADAVVAIQAEEGKIVRQHLPTKPVILAPMAITPVDEAQPGDDGSLLFVGSNTLPNIDGIGWFLMEVWPAVLSLLPDANLRIAGTCCGGLGALPPNVTLLGRVDRLDELYRRAGVVISPLRMGSGLKIKLVEAMGHGKASVVTATTLQGVHDIVGDAVVRADEVAEFVRALSLLLNDRAERARLGAEALAVATRHFSATACYRDLLDFIRDPTPMGARPVTNPVCC